MGWFNKKSELSDEMYKQAYQKEKLKLAEQRGMMAARQDSAPRQSGFKSAIRSVGSSLESAARQRGDFIGSGFFPATKAKAQYKRVRVAVKPKSKKFKYIKRKVKTSSSYSRPSYFSMRV